MKILVTGGAGFIGSHITDELVKQGHDVRIMDNIEPQVHGSKAPTYLSKDAEFVHGNVTKIEDWMKALKGVDAIVHQAAMVGVGQSMYQPVRYHMVNTIGTALMYEAIMNGKFPIQKIIVASSKSTYGEGAYFCEEHGEVWPGLRSLKQLENKEWEVMCPKCGRHVKPIPTAEHKPPQNLSVYAISKYDQEKLAIDFGHALKIPTVAFRYFNVYGPRQSLNNPYTGLCAIFSSRIKNGNCPVIYEDGLQSRDFVYVSDIVQANVLALEKAEGVKVYNVGTGMPTTVLDVANTLIKLYGSDVKPEISQKFRVGDNRHDYADISLIQKELGFKPRVKFSEGMKQLVEWGRTTEAIDRFEEADREFKESLSR
jgi:dTDP-L-rhamnose 4-epimerase